MIGFVLNYRRSDSTIAVLQLATWLEELGLDVSIFSTGPPLPVCSRWDKRVKRDCGKQSSIVDWSHAVFANAPSEALVSILRDNRTKMSLICSWEELLNCHHRVIESVDTVICPSRTSYRYMKAAPLAIRQLLKMPWDLLMPPIQRDQEVDPKRIGIVWNLDGSQAESQDFGFFDTLTSLLKIKSLYFTVFWNDGLSQEARDCLDDLRCRADGRVELIKNASIEKQILLSSAHDLTLWPSKYDNFGFPGLVSLTAGTPCIAYDHPVIGEIIKDQESGLLVPCELAFTPMDVPLVVPDNDKFKSTVLDLVNDPYKLQSLRSTAQIKASDRRGYFCNTVKQLFGL